MTFAQVHVGSMFSMPHENGVWIKVSNRSAVREYDSDRYSVRGSQIVELEGEVGREDECVHCGNPVGEDGKYCDECREFQTYNSIRVF